uniref:SFRICE_017319 n=1 Tax=Spodoptera frugiperda TaxID=7108 RepID=A0A2H1WHJ8_SPOFR
MAKIVSILMLVVAVITVQGQAPEYAEVIKAAKAGNWDQVQELEQPYDEVQASYNEDDELNSNLGKQAGWKPPLFDSLRDLKPENGGHVYGEAEYAYHSASNVNGKTTEHNAGHKIINEDGRVKEFDFTPSTSHAPLLQSLVSSLGQKAADFAASDYHYQYGGSVAGKPNFAAQKLSNNVQQDYYPRNSAVVPIPPKKLNDSTKPQDVEYEYVLTSGTEDDKPPREINVSEENKYNTQHEAEQNNEIAQADQTYNEAGKEEKYKDGLKYLIDIEEPPEAKPVTTNDNNTPTPFKSTVTTTEPKFLLRVADVAIERVKRLTTTVQPDDYMYNVAPRSLEDGVMVTSTDRNKENKIKNSYKDTPILIPFEEKPIYKAAPITPRTTDVPTPSRLPIENLFSNIDYMAEPAVTGKSMIKFDDQNQEKNQNVTTVTRKKSKMSDADYIAYVASAIEDRLDQISQQLDKTDFNKLNSEIFSTTKKTTKKERSQKFLEEKPLFSHSFDKKFAYKNSSSYLDTKKPEHIQRKQFRASTSEAYSSLTFTNVRDLKPPQGGHVYGEAQYAYHTATNINGQKTEDAGGHKIINNDGKVKEFDFTPKPKFGPVSYF